MPLKIVPQRDRELNQLLEDGEEILVGRGGSLYESGERAEDLFLVREGHIRLTLPPDPDGRERTTAVAGPWELFGEEALVDRARRRYGARAGEDARLASIDGERAFRALQEMPRTLPLLLDAASVDLLRARWPSPGGSGPSTSQRLADLLLEFAQRFGKKEDAGIRIPHWFTHQELADLVGAHRSTVTSQLNDWLYEGLLKEGSNEVVITQWNALEQRSSGRERCVSSR